MGNATNNFIEPILSVIPSPKTDNLTGMIASYAKVLNEFSDEALELAATTIIRTMKYKSMPLPGECIKACREAQKTLALRRHRDASKRKKTRAQVTWTDNDAKRADELFRSHWGERAVKDGVELALWDFLVQRKQWPNSNEYLDLKAKSLARQKDLEDFIQYHRINGGIKPGAQAWINTMNRKSAKLRSLVAVDNGGEDAA